MSCTCENCSKKCQNCGCKQNGNHDIGNILSKKLCHNLMLYPGINKVPALRKKAPYFKGKAMVEGQIKDVSLDDYKGKYLVLFFYPYDFSFVCPTEIIAFGDEIENFRELNCEVVAASTDSVYCHIEWMLRPREEGGIQGMGIPIIGDVTKKIASDYGALIETEDGLSAAFRATYIIDEDQILRAALIQDTPIGRSTVEIRRLIEALIFHKNNGDVCPANWKPGDKGKTAQEH